MVSIAARSTHDLTPVHVKSLSLHGVFMLLPILRDEGREMHGEILGELTNLVEGGKVSPLVHEEVFDFQEVGRAHEALESGNAIGKVALRASW